MTQPAKTWTEDSFRIMAENCPDIIDWFDSDLRHLYVNAAGLRQLSLPAEKVIGRTVRETGVPEPFCSLWDERVLRVLKTAKPLEVSDTFPGPNGLTFFNSLCVPNFDDTGMVRSVLVMSRDITERKNAEDELRRSEADLAEAQHLAKMGNWKRDVATRRIRLSRELFRVFDIDATDDTFSEAPFYERIHPFDRDLVSRTKDAIMTIGKPFEIEFRIVTRSGETRHIRAMGYARKDEKGDVAEIFGTAQDISESKRAEECQRRLNEELEDRVKQRTAKLRELALELTRAEQKEQKRISEVLHEDIQQQLVAVRFKLEQIRQRAGTSQSGTDLDWALENLRKASEQIRHLSVRMRPPVLYDFGLKPAIEWLATEMKGNFGLAVNVQGDKLPDIRSEEIASFAFSAVSELLLNVVKHSGAKSACVLLSAPRGHTVTVTVSDKGSGFDFASALKKNTFGLFSIRERAETLGGRLVITAAAGKGTCAALTLPIK